MPMLILSDWVAMIAGGVFSFMANRILRDWTTSEKIDNLSFEAEVLFTRLIMKADDHGCFHANPKLLKAAIFPLKDVSVGMVSLYLKELIQNDIVLVYISEGREYLQILNFGQRLRTMKSKFPLPVSNSRTIDSNERPETKRSRNEVETETESEVAKNFEWFLKQFDEMFVDTLKMTHKGKDFMQAAKESFAHLAADPIRLKMAESHDCKKLLNTWLANQKNKHNGIEKLKSNIDAGLANIEAKYGNPAK